MNERCTLLYERGTVLKGTSAVLYSTSAVAVLYKGCIVRTLYYTVLYCTNAELDCTVRKCAALYERCNSTVRRLYCTNAVLYQPCTVVHERWPAYYVTACYESGPAFRDAFQGGRRLGSQFWRQSTGRGEIKVIGGGGSVSNSGVIDEAAPDEAPKARAAAAAAAPPPTIEAERPAECRQGPPSSQ